MKVSVIIAGNGEQTPLRRCLERLFAQADDQLQVIVAFGGHPDLASVFGPHAANAEAIGFRSPTALHVLRGAALERATGEIVAFLDPYAIPTSNWLTALRDGHQNRPNRAIGGPVDLEDAEQRGVLDWALYINEYGMFLPPMEEQSIELLPGCNLAYKRSALFEGGASRAREFWKTFVNDGLRESGEELLIAPAMLVSLDKRIAFADYLLRRFDHGRCYGAMSSQGRSAAARLARAAAAPVLPVVLLARWSLRYWARDRYRGKLIATLPLQFLLFSCWIAGETLGRLFGGGHSCSRLYY